MSLFRCVFPSAVFVISEFILFVRYFFLSLCPSLVIYLCMSFVSSFSFLCMYSISLSLYLSRISLFIYSVCISSFVYVVFLYFVIYVFRYLFMLSCLPLDMSLCVISLGLYFFSSFVSDFITSLVISFCRCLFIYSFISLFRLFGLYFFRCFVICLLRYYSFVCLCFCFKSMYLVIYGFRSLCLSFLISFVR